MMNKFLYYNDLFAVYGSLLTQNEQEIFREYYGENHSMGEIAENRGISRSAVGNSIKTGEKKLDEYESILKVVSRNQKLEAICEKINDESLKKELEELLK